MDALDARADLARFVGGCVRDHLRGDPVDEIDIATRHRPEETIRRLQAAGLHVITPGLAHGTVTAIVADRCYEITTLRRDVETDGRHAVVSFTDDWATDAKRRDFTMNAMFMGIDGSLFDPESGADDARKGRVRFVGEPRRRIAEDRLRILRFFRFQAYYGCGQPDPDGFAACREMAGEITMLSGERIRAELLKLLAAPGAAQNAQFLHRGAILQALFPTPLAVDSLHRLVAMEECAPDPLRRLAVLVREPAVRLAERLCLSTRQQNRLIAMQTDRVVLDGADEYFRARLYALGPARFRDAVLISAACEPRAAGGRERALALADRWKPPAFPLRGADLVQCGLSGRRIGRILRAVERRWIGGDFRGDREACLAWARSIAELDQERV